jgi:hypothetical protein
MANIVTIADYLVGSVVLQQDDTTEERFDSIRDEYQNNYIYKLLGAELGGLFLADLDGSGVPVTARFLAIYNAFQEDDSCGMQISKGIKFYIKNTIWFYFARINNTAVTVAGNISKLGENSEPSFSGKNLAYLYNQAVDTGLAIQWYIRENSTVYPEYNGQFLDYVTGIR